jgi:daunorubicin resistance ABC transporter membrane protein
MDAVDDRSQHPAPHSLAGGDPQRSARLAERRDRAVDEPASTASLARLNLATVRVLVARDLRRFFRQPSRVVGALVQPLIFWLVIGSGMASSFRMPGAEQVGYVQYFYPGIVMLVVLFTSIFTTMSVIEDRHKGFLQAVLVAPASRASLVLGKTLGGVTIALAQAAIFLALAPLAGFDAATIHWPALALQLIGVGVGLSSLGFAIAWWLDSTQGYHVVMSVLLIPLWILSGAMFPTVGGPRWIGWLMRANPMAYAVAGVRRALYGGRAPGAVSSTSALELAVTWLFALVAVMIAVRVCNRRGNKP